MTSEKKSVLFICLGNICRSPIAEALFNHLIKQRNVEEDWIVDSAATGHWHVGEQPDERTFKVLSLKGLHTYKHEVRQMKDGDYKKFQVIFGMDDANMTSLEEKKPADFKGSIELLGTYDPEGVRIIRDPYYDNDDKGFYKCYDHCRRCLVAYLDKIYGPSA